MPQISPEWLHGLISENPHDVQVVDVRRPAEWEEGHLEGAILKPLSNLANKMGDLDPERPIAAHCKSGYRSSIATSLFQRAGYNNVMNLAGGFDAWRAKNLPFVTTESFV